MSDTSILVTASLKELEAEATATRKCLENIKQEKFDFKPHPTSMSLSYLALLVAEIPLWVIRMVEDGEIDLATFKHGDIKNTKQLVAFFDENMAGVKNALENVSPDELEKDFHLKTNGKTVFSIKRKDYIGPTINHWIHHRGQLTVYMRICEIPVPSIYGPSGDDKQF